MIDTTSEKLIRLQDVRDYIPSSRSGKKLGKAAAFRWAFKGTRGIKLETLRIGGCRFTSVEAVARFIAAQNTTPTTPPKNPASTPSKRSLKAEKALSALGI